MKILALRHVPHEHLGLLSDILDEAGIEYEYVNLWEDATPEINLGRASGLIILGGPMNVYEADKFPFLELEDAVIKEAVARKIPTLGICLGAQLLAKSLGARVIKNHEKEIGWYPLRISDEGACDKLFGNFSLDETVFQWHGDTFDIPSGAAHLASSALCQNQAFRYGESAYGLQFHIEVTEPMVSEWLAVAENREEIAALGGKIEPAAILNETPKRIGRLNSLARRVFLELCQLIKS
ncbi:MAG: type 1 glutamine amidotransferase [Deltaproteobacteria bacterium]